jgi:DNA-binding MarR family transcriptional regulator
MMTARDRIERAGYARRLRDPNDRRGVLMELTDKGRDAIEPIWGEYARSADSLYSSYSNAGDERDQSRAS